LVALISSALILPAFKLSKTDIILLYIFILINIIVNMTILKFYFKYNRKYYYIKILFEIKLLQINK
jgi:hypothetical protein